MNSPLTVPVGNHFLLRQFKNQMVKVGKRMLSHTFSGRLRKKKFSTDNIHVLTDCVLTDFTKPMNRYSHRFGQDLDTKQNDPASEIRAASYQGIEELKYQSS